MEEEKQHMGFSKLSDQQCALYALNVEELIRAPNPTLIVTSTSKGTTYFLLYTSI